MKKNFIIVAFWIFTLLGAFALKANAQDSAKVLLADETTISYMKTDCKIESSSDIVVNKIMKRYEQAIKRFSWSWKTDRHGKYKLYTIYIQKDMGEEIISWSKNNL